MKRTIVCCLASLFPVIGWSADLLDVYREAVANDASFAAARAELEAGQEFAVQARAGLLPNVGASASVTGNRVDARGRSADTFSSDSWGVQLIQPLYRMQNRIAAQQGALRTEFAEVQFDLARQDLMLRVSDAYFNVLNAQEQLEVVTQLRAAAAEQLDIAQTSYEVGTVTITDVHEAQARFDLALAQVIAAQAELDVRRHALAQIIGREPEPLVGLRREVELTAPRPDDPAEWVSAAELGGFGVQLQHVLREIAAREVERARAGRLPTVDLVASHGHSGQSGREVAALPRSDSTSIGVQLNVPLYAGGGITSRAREAAALRVRADADLERARRDAALAARQAYLGVTSGRARIQALEAAEVSSLSALEANRLGYEVGVRINIDVLNAQSQLADTRQELARARYDTLLAQLRLKAAAGTLDEEDLAIVNTLLGD
jgi:outer membrane protein